MTEQLVSVVMCTYNGEQYVQEQVESILQQTHINLELIISDDASTDKTFEILQQLAANDERVILNRNEKNLGYNLNFSNACKKAKGEFIAIADQDDIWELNKLELLVSELNKNASAILVHSISARFEERDKPHLQSLKKVNYLTGNDIRKFFMLNIVSGHNMLFRTQLLQKSLPFPSQVYYDWWLVANACVISNITAVEKILVWHRMHNSNATGAAKPKLFLYQQVQTILPKILNIEGIKPEHKEFGERLLHYYSEFPRKNFSLPLFWFLLKNARVIFAYKKRAFPWISYIKHSFKSAKKNTLA